MPKFFIDEKNISDTQIFIVGADIKHITKVLRKQIGDILEISDGHGNNYLAEISEMSKVKIIANIVSREIDNESEIKITLFQALPKSTKMDLIIQKSTELGVHEIIPFVSHRTIVEIKDKKSEQKKIERWQKIAFEACKQCQRVSIPKVSDVYSWNNLIKSIPNYDLCIVAYENEETNRLRDILSSSEAHNICIIIGPEGGFEESEISQIVSEGGTSVSLGKRILRTETAGMVMIGLIMYELGEL